MYLYRMMGRGVFWGQSSLSVSPSMSDYNLVRSLERHEKSDSMTCVSEVKVKSNAKICHSKSRPLSKVYILSIYYNYKRTDIRRFKSIEYTFHTETSHVVKEILHNGENFHYNVQTV